MHVIVNNIYIILIGQDTSLKPTHQFAKYDLLIRLALRLLGALVPIATAFGIANLIQVLNYAGLIGFAVCFGFPPALQLRSIYVCKRKFASVLNYRKNSAEVSEITHSVQEKSPLLHGSTKFRVKDEQSLYMTPYSSRILSRPLAVVIVGLMGIVMFALSFSNLFTNKSTELCNTGFDDDLMEVRLSDEL